LPSGRERRSSGRREGNKFGWAGGKSSEKKEALEQVRGAGSGDTRTPEVKTYARSTTAQAVTQYAFEERSPNRKKSERKEKES